MKASELITKLIASMAISGDDPVIDILDRYKFAREISSVEVFPSPDGFPARIIIDTTGPEDPAVEWGLNL